MEKAKRVPNDKIKEVKESIANTALEQLEKGKDLSELAYTKVEFGYIYLRAGNYEALFKVITDKMTIFFAAQQGKLIRLGSNFSEAQFQGTIKQMESLHGDWK